MMPKKKRLTKTTKNQDKLYKEWFYGQRDAVEVAKGGPILVGPKKKKKKKGK